MINWIQQLLEKGGRWVFLFLLIIIVIAFVFTIGSAPGLVEKEKGGFQDYYGINLNSQKVIDEIVKDVITSSILSTGRRPYFQQGVETDVLRRIALLHLADELNIPHPKLDQIQNHVSSLYPMKGEDGSFSPEKYTEVIDLIKSDPRLDENRIPSVLESDYRINFVANALFMKGLVLDEEIALETKREHAIRTAEFLELSYAAYSPEIEIIEENITDYYEENSINYETAELRKASYCLIPYGRFIDKTKAPTEQEIFRYFLANESNYPIDAAEGAVKPLSYADLNEKTIIKVTTDFLINNAKQPTQAFASDIAYQLFDQAIGLDSDLFNAYLKTNDLTLHQINAYGEGSLPVSKMLSAEALKSVFNLTEKQYFTDAYPSEKGFILMFLNGIIKPSIPELSAIKEEVVTDYKKEQKKTLFSEFGKEIKEKLSTAILEGKSLKEVAETLQLTYRIQEKYTFNDAPKELDRQLLSESMNVSVGEISDMITLKENGNFIHLKSVEAASEETLTEFMDVKDKQLQSMYSYISNQAFISELMSKGSSNK